MVSPDIVSIGYEGRTPGELVELLQSHLVVKVLDVRELPFSRRKGFSKTPLSATLVAACIEYCHVRAAGNPYRKLKADTDRCLELYAEHLAAHPEILDLVRAECNGRTALLCYERAHNTCHRSRLIQALLAQDPLIQVIRID